MGPSLDKYLREKKPGSPRIFQISRIEEFVEVATWLYASDYVIFRGQRQDWPLVPSVGRDPYGKSSKEKEVLEEFKREALPYLGFIPDNDNEWHWLAAAQHNRLPTRLLDWSKNPLVGLWFAVREPAHGEEPGIVWAHCYEPSEAICTTKKRDTPFSIDRTFVYLPEHVFPYIQAQSGVFTVHHRRPKDDAFVPFQETEDADSRLTKIEISAESFATIRYKLFRLGINPASLFPGLSGLVERIKYQNERMEDETGT